MPVDAVGNPWSGSYVYNSGNLVLDLLYDLMLESTGRLQKCRLYEMSDNKAFRSTVSYLIVRDLVMSPILMLMILKRGRTEGHNSIHLAQI